jgi:hypothetical protein
VKRQKPLNRLFLTFRSLTMNRTSFAAKTLIVSLGLFAAFASQAADYSVDLYSESGTRTVLSAQSSTPSLSRMDVLLELARARKAGELNHIETSFVPTPVGMPLTRAQVKAELLEAIRIGALEHGERSFTPSAEQLESIRLAGLRAITMNVATR